jgi:hypothetical protein
MCGAPVGSASDEEPLMHIVPGEVWELCEVDFWRGYLKSDFFAHRLGRESGPEIARSPMFRWRGDATPAQDNKIVAAHEQLVEALLTAGWERMGMGEHTPWYAQRFRRRVGRALPAEPSPPADKDAGEERAEDSKEEAAP